MAHFSKELNSMVEISNLTRNYGHWYVLHNILGIYKQTLTFLVVEFWQCWPHSSVGRDKAFTQIVLWLPDTQTCILYTYTTCKTDHRPKFKIPNFKTLGHSIGISLCDLELGSSFLNKTAKPRWKYFKKNKNKNRFHQI